MDELVRTYMLSEAMTNVVLDVNCSESLRAKKMEAVQSAFAINRGYEKHGFREDLLETQLAKRLVMIRDATTAGQLKEIMNPKPPRYDGNEFYPASVYSIPEEEMIAWSTASLAAPLKESAMKRYLSLFEQFFGYSVLDEMR